MVHNVSWTKTWHSYENLKVDSAIALRTTAMLNLISMLQFGFTARCYSWRLVYL